MENSFEKSTQEMPAEEQADNRTKEEKLKSLKDWREQVLGGVELNGGRWTREDRKLVDELEEKIKELEK